MDLRKVTDALRAIRSPRPQDEYDLHGLTAEALQEADISFIHEAPLAPRCRVDFLCEDVGIEIKKGRPRSAVLRSQLCRYLDGTPLRAVILVSQLPCTLPEEICGKRVYTVSLNRLWGVALH